jgi:nitrogen regulatory protein A
MNELKRACIEMLLQTLRAEAGTDVAALAWRDEAGRGIRWISASGNRNERYKHMLLKPGRGLTGIVFRIGQPVVFDSAVPEYQVMRHEYPIILSEQLQTAALLPVKLGNETCGVLLLGSRTPLADTEPLLRISRGMPERIGSVMQNPTADAAAIT